MENLYLKASLERDAQEVCQKEDARDLVTTALRIAHEPIEPRPSRENGEKGQERVFKELERAKNIALENLERGLILEKVLEDIEKLREIVELALAKHCEVVLEAHRLTMAIVKAGKKGVLEVLARQGAETRDKIVIVHRFMKAIVEAGGDGVLEVLTRQEAKTRAKIARIREPFGDLDEE